MDYYAVLGVSKDASLDQIKNAFRKLARIYHPDVSDLIDAETKFKEINIAYSVLSDDKKKSDYDKGSMDDVGIDIDSLDITVKPETITDSLIVGKVAKYTIVIDSLNGIYPGIDIEETHEPEWMTTEVTTTADSIYPIKLKFEFRFKKAGNYAHQLKMITGGVVYKVINISFNVRVPTPHFQLSRPGWDFETVLKGSNAKHHLLTILNTGDLVENTKISFELSNPTLFQIAKKSDSAFTITPNTKALDAGYYSAKILFTIKYLGGSTNLEFSMTATIRDRDTSLSFENDVNEAGPIWFEENNELTIYLNAKGDIPNADELNLEMRDSPKAWNVKSISRVNDKGRFKVIVELRSTQKKKQHHEATLIAYLDNKALASAIVRVYNKGEKPVLTLQSVTHSGKRTVAIGDRIKGVINLHHTGADIDSLTLTVSGKPRDMVVTTKPIINNGRVQSVEYEITYTGEAGTQNPIIYIDYTQGKLPVKFEIDYYSYGKMLAGCITVIAIIFMLAGGFAWAFWSAEIIEKANELYQNLLRAPVHQSFTPSSLGSEAVTLFSDNKYFPVWNSLSWRADARMVGFSNGQSSYVFNFVDNELYLHSSNAPVFHPTDPNVYGGVREDDSVFIGNESHDFEFDLSEFAEFPSFAWSRMGNQFAVIGGPERYFDIYINGINEDRVITGNQGSVLSQPQRPSIFRIDASLSDVYNIDWSPNGELIALSAKEVGANYPSLYVYNLNDHSIRSLNILGCNPEWTRDSQKIVYNWFDPELLPIQNETGDWCNGVGHRIYTIHTGFRPVPQMLYDFDSWGAEFSPNGNQLAFFANYDRQNLLSVSIGRYESNYGVDIFP